MAQQKVGDFFVPTFTGGLAMPGLLHTLGAQECRVTACLGPTAWRETHKLTDKSVTHATVESWVGVHRRAQAACNPGWEDLGRWRGDFRRESNFVLEPRV